MSDLVNELVQWLSEDWQDEAGLTRGFIIPALIPLGASFFGAYFAFSLSRRQSRRDEILNNIKELAGAAAYSATIANSAISFKRQQVVDLVERYSADRNKTLLQLGAPTVRKEIIVEFNLESLQASDFPIDALRVCAGKSELDTQEIGLMEALATSCWNVRTLIASRNEWIEEFRRSRASDFQKLSIYFGIEGAREVDARYKSYIEGIGEDIDRVIGLALLLHIKLLKKRIGLLAKLHALGGTGKVNNFYMVIDEAQSEGLIPNRADFSDFERSSETQRRPWYRSKKQHRKKLVETIDAIWEKPN